MKTNWKTKALAEIKTAPAAPKPKRAQFIAKQLIYGRIPDESHLWPVVEVCSTTVLRGGGESTSWHPFSTVRYNGKQILRQARGCDNPLPELFGNRLIHAGREGNAEIYVLRPEQPAK